jgi:hypothetical protein
MSMLRQFQLVAAGALALLATLAFAVEPQGKLKPKPETPVLNSSEYRTPLDQVIVTGHSPYWQQQQAPRWDKPKTEDLQAPPSRLQLAPRYTRDERDEYNGVRDNQNPQPRTKLFELKF